MAKILLEELNIDVRNTANDAINFCNKIGGHVRVDVQDTESGRIVTVSCLLDKAVDVDEIRLVGDEIDVYVEKKPKEKELEGLSKLFGPILERNTIKTFGTTRLYKKFRAGGGRADEITFDNVGAMSKVEGEMKINRFDMVINVDKNNTYIEFL